MKRLFAYAFQTDLRLDEIEARLNREGPWSWIARDSDRWGDYLSTRARRPGASVNRW